jgi:uncharacterized repeat protein (TIGR01451 family)
MNERRFHIGLSFWAGLLLVASMFCTGQVLAQTPAGTRVLNEAQGTFRYKTGVKDSVRSNMTATLVQLFSSVASSIEMYVSPPAIIGNGTDTASVSVIVLDASGNRVPDGAIVSLASTAGTFRGGKDSISISTVNGVVSVPITSVAVTQQIISAQISATTMGANYEELVARSSLLYYPGALTGSVVSGYTGRPASGAVVVAQNQAQNEEGRDTTGSDGTYFIPVRTAGAYTHTINYSNRFGNQVQATFREDLPIPAQGGIPAVGTWNVISGNVVDRATGNPIRKAGIHVSLKPSGSLLIAGGSSLPVFRVTDERGIFQFDSLTPGVYEIRVSDAGYAGTVVVYDTVKNSFMVDIGLGIADVPAFEVVKNVNKRIAEIGDAVAYVLDLRNGSAATPLTNIRIVDALPLGFMYVTGSSRHNQMPIADPSGSHTVEWVLADTLQPGKTAHLSYMVTIGAAAMEGDGVNHAYGIAQDLAGDSVQSTVASVSVAVRPGVFTDHGIVIGKVFYDVMENGIQDFGEAGIAGVELWMEDGTHIVTGDDGKYSLPDVKPGQHVIRVDQRTLPTGSVLLAPNTETAGDGTSRFIRLVDGGVARADFYVRQPQQASVQLSVAPSPHPGVLQASFVVSCSCPPMPSAIVLLDTLPRGLLYDLQTLEVNGAPLAGLAGQSHSLRAELPIHPGQSPDTVTVDIVKEDSCSRRVGVARPRLVVSYPRHRDAVFKTVETFAVPGDASLGSLTGPPAGDEGARKQEREQEKGSR